VRARFLPSLVAVAALVALVGDGTVTASRADGPRVPDETRSISYFPAKGGWTLMWTRFDAGAIDRDFERVAWLGANTVRVIVPANTFGYPEPDPAMRARLERVVEIAGRRGLRVELTLFDWWHAYSDVAGSRRWAAALLSPYRDDARIAFVELKNELRPQDEGAPGWAAALIPYVRELTRKPVTI
jgi:endo-1,4-beta-mannosidase